MRSEKDKFIELVNHTRIASNIGLVISIIGMITSAIGIVFELGNTNLLLTSFFVCVSSYLVSCHLLSITE